MLVVEAPCRRVRPAVRMLLLLLLLLRLVSPGILGDHGYSRVLRKPAHLFRPGCSRLGAPRVASGVSAAQARRDARDPRTGHREVSERRSRVGASASSSASQRRSGRREVSAGKVGRVPSRLCGRGGHCRRGRVTTRSLLHGLRRGRVLRAHPVSGC